MKKFLRHLDFVANALDIMGVFKAREWLAEISIRERKEDRGRLEITQPVKILLKKKKKNMRKRMLAVEEWTVDGRDFRNIQYRTYETW